jgi:DNA-binding beta-propeller fold protein YncE
VIRSLRGYAIVCTLTLAFTPAAFAQDPGSGRRGGDRPSLVDQIKDVVGLKDDQIAKVKAIDEQARADMAKAREDAGEDRAAMREKMKPIQDKERADVRALLDPAQQAKFDEWAKAQDAQRGGRGGPGSRGDEKPVNGKPDKTIVLPGSGGFDYLNADAASRKLYVAHSKTIDVIDMDKDEKIGEVTGIDGAHGVAIAAAAKHGFATSGKNQKLIAFDLDTNKVLKEIDTGAGPDAAIYASSVDEAFSINHKGGTVTCVDAKTFEVKATIQIGGTLEFAAEIGDRVFVNIEDKNQVAVIDAKKHELVTKYEIAPGEGPAGLCSDPKNGLLFVGCRNKKLVVLEAASGKVVTSFDIGQGCDACSFDSDSGKVYASCGDGMTSVFHVSEATKIEAVKTIETIRGGKTCAVDSKTHKLYVSAAPRRGEKGDAKVLVFNPEGTKAPAKND